MAADTTAILSAAIVIMVGLILNMVWTGVAARHAKETRFEVKPNHSHSMRDAIDRIEDKQTAMRTRIDSIDQRLATVENLTLAQLSRQPQFYQNERDTNG